MSALLCRWCGETYEQHAESFPDGAVARMPCLGLRSGFSAETTVETLPAPDLTIQIVSAKHGHRWIASVLRPDHVRCCSCGDWWPIDGDLAPMPECPGEVDLRGKLDAAERQLATLRTKLKGVFDRLDELVGEVVES